MLSNLVSMVAQTDDATGAVRVIRASYGADAVDEVDAALAQPGLDARGARRLAALRASLSQ
jgi:hypothetical protein